MQDNENSFGGCMKKLNNISLLRFVAILLVFTCHILQPISLTQGKQFFPFAFGVQIFLFISGFLYSRKEIDDYKSFYKKNLTKLLLPTAVFICLWLLIACCFVLISNTTFADFCYHTTVSGNVVSNYGHLWYIECILICYFSLPVLKNLHKRYCVLLLILFFVIDFLAILFIEFPIFFTPFFLGFMFYKFVNSQIYQRIKYWIITLCLLVFGISVYLYIITFNSEYLLTTLPALRTLALGIFPGIFAVCFSVVFYESFIFTNKYERLANLLKYTDKYIFPFYFMHSFVIFSANCLMIYITPYLAINIILILIISIVSTILFQLLIDAIMYKPKK